jgi:transposase InsO family protein
MEKTSYKYEVIHDTLQESPGVFNVTILCELAGVSRSGYYAWIKAAPARDKRDAQDKADFELILAVYKKRGYAKGARSIYMGLLHRTPPVIMNIKKIRRLMNKYNLFCPIRKANPYRRMAKALATNNVAPNVVNREFKQKPRKVLLTDITYLFFGSEGKCYLSTILDAFTHEILAYCVSLSLKVDFVIATVGQLVAEHGSTLDNESIVHSDQGAHYTSYAFIQKLKDEEFVQSMSRRGNCWDNAPQESFFGHMKDEICEAVAGCIIFEDVVAKVDDWIDYYNNDRYQWDLLKLSPKEYYQYLQTGVYPLPVYDPKKQ